MALPMGNALRRMTVGQRKNMGLGAIGPNHPRIKAMMRNGGLPPEMMAKAPSAGADES